jgi:hypothetical protein
MEIKGRGELLRVFIGEGDKYRGGLLYEKMVLRMRELGIAGCTVVRGIEGFGAGSVIHKTNLLRLSEDLPIIVEVVDTMERISMAIEEIEKMLNESGCGALMTREKVDIIRYNP